MKDINFDKNKIFLHKVRELVLQNLSEPSFGTKQLAKKMAISESHLFRKIKSLTDQSTAVHIRSIRLLKAKELLLKSHLNISEIAYRTGFNDPSYFSRTFLKEFGKTPSVIRQKYIVYAIIIFINEVYKNNPGI